MEGYFPGSLGGARFFGLDAISEGVKAGTLAMTRSGLQGPRLDPSFQNKVTGEPI